MNKTINIEIKDVSKLIDKSYLAECIASKVVHEKTNQSYDYFDQELVKRLDDAVKRIVIEYMESYGGNNEVRCWVKEGLDKMTKDEIIKALKS